MMMIMLSPNPFSLLCAILLCLPLALLFTISSDDSITATTAISTTYAAAFSHSRLILASPPILKPSSNPTKNSSLPPLPLLSISNLTSIAPSQPPPPTPPFWLDYEKSDTDLFKRASLVNPKPTRGKKKIAFMFLTTAPLPFAPLWDVFFKDKTSKGKYNVYVHADPEYEYDPPFSGVFSGRVIPSSKPTRRNSPTLVSAARRLLAHALLDDPANHMFVLLSASCIPIHSFNFTYTTLAGSSKSFIEILANETTAYSRWVARGEDAMLPEVGLDVFRVGSQFWSLTRRHARVVVRDVRLWRKFRLPCVVLDNTCFPEENYFPTLLSMVDPRGVVPATLTNVNWQGSWDGHPHTYNATEVDPELIQWLRETRPRYGGEGVNGSDLSVTERWDPFLFARKFAPECMPQLLRLAKDHLFKDQE